MSAADAFSAANAAFVEEEYDEALRRYSEALDLDRGNANYWSARAQCHLKLENFVEALQDADEALRLSPQNHKAMLRKGIALFSLEKFESAVQALQAACQDAGVKVQASRWLRKAQAELDAQGGGVGMSGDVAPVTLDQQPQQPQEADTSSAGTETAAAATSDTQPQVTSSVDSVPPPVPSLIQDPNKTKFDWFQSFSHVTVEIQAADVLEQHAFIEIRKDEVEVRIQLSAGKEFQLDLELFAPVIPEESEYKIRSNKVEIRLKKASNVKWSSLECKSSGEVQVVPAVAPGSGSDPRNYPSSSRKRVDWDSVASQEKDELEGGGLNKVLAHIYGGADADQQKAMMKSFYESGGTVLSTNWEDVGSRYVEGSAPEGMEMKDWSALTKGERAARKARAKQNK